VISLEFTVQMLRTCWISPWHWS